MRTAPLSQEPLPALDPDQPLADWPGEQVDVGDYHLLVRSTPGPTDGEPAVYIHGLGGASSNWTDLAYLLSGHMSGEALDLPGFGEAAPPESGRYGPGDHADAVISYLQSKGDREVHLLGNSLGGVVSILVAARRPTLVKTLTLISPAMPQYVPGPGQAMMALPALPGVVSLQRALSKKSPEDRVDEMIRAIYGDPTRMPEARRQAMRDDFRGRADLEHAVPAYVESLRGLIRTYVSMRGRYLWLMAQRLSMPTLIIWGGKDRIVSPSLAPKLERTIPNSRLLTLPGAGHVPQMEDPVPVARAILALTSGG